VPVSEGGCIKFNKAIAENNQGEAELRSEPTLRWQIDCAATANRPGCARQPTGFVWLPIFGLIFGLISKNILATLH
jgi:hypothetical protein